MSLSDSEVWSAVQTLRVDGEDLYPSLREHMLASGFLEGAGATLEVGAGDGTLWRAGGETSLRLALALGPVVLTDRHPQPVLNGVWQALADAAALPFGDAAFSRALAVHVLHWCDVAAALADLSRVLRPGGRLFVVTVDERVHLAEVYQLMREAGARLEARGAPLSVEIPTQPPRIGRFSAGNAETRLGRAFAKVVRVDFDYAHLFEPRHPSLAVDGAELLARYVASAPFLQDQPPATAARYVGEVKALAAQAISARGVFRASRRDVLYDCSAPR